MESYTPTFWTCNCYDYENNEETSEKKNRRKESLIYDRAVDVFDEQTWNQLKLQLSNYDRVDKDKTLMKQGRIFDKTNMLCPFYILK